MAQATDTISQSIHTAGQIRKRALLKEIPDEADQYTYAIVTLDRVWCVWALEAVNAEVENIISEVSGMDDAVWFTDSSMKRGEQCEWLGLLFSEDRLSNSS